MENITSEQQLKELLNEGKITQAEYDELQDAMRQKDEPESNVVVSNVSSKNHKHLCGKIALVLMLLGIILPVIGYAAVDLVTKALSEQSGATLAPWFFLAVVIEIAALVMGIIAWPDPFGKAAVIASSIMLVLMILILISSTHRKVEVVELTQIGKLSELSGE